MKSPTALLRKNPKPTDREPPEQGLQDNSKQRAQAARQAVRFHIDDVDKATAANLCRPLPRLAKQDSIVARLSTRSRAMPLPQVCSTRTPIKNNKGHRIYPFRSYLKKG